MQYVIGVVLGFAAFVLAYGLLAGAWAFVVAKTTPLADRSAAYDRGRNVPFVVALAAGGYVFYLTALA